MPPDSANIRKERIEKLLYELRYEVERGMLEREIDEEITFRFIVPLSQVIKNGVVYCEFRTQPRSHHDIFGIDKEPRLRVIEGGKP